MTKRIAILHYASPPTIGGVESVIEHQARGLADQGYAVRVITGSGKPFDPRVENVLHPLFGSTHPDVLAVKSELDRGQVSPAFYILVERLATALREALSGYDVCIAHNIPTMHKNLPLTAALAQIAASDILDVIAWPHDLAWTNAQYQPELYEGFPWDLLRQAWGGVKYVTVSEMRRAELAALLDVPAESITVIGGGIDPARFFRWRDDFVALVTRLNLLDADGIFLLPARLTRRKNIALALHVLAAIRTQSGCDFRLIVTGPPGPHNPSNPGYLGELLDLRRELKLQECAHFLYELGANGEPFIPDDETVASLYQVSDALFFPSTQEGFGIPILEAGLAGIPIFCADIPPLRATGQADVTYFDPVNDSPDHIASRALATLESNSAARLRRRMRQSFRWDALIRDQLVPLLEA
jgi:glycosyltransferase involved in cell wall biosynthesis